MGFFEGIVEITDEENKEGKSTTSDTEEKAVNTKSMPKEKSQNHVAENSNSVISFGTKVEGNINSDGGVSVNGNIKGNVTAKGGISVLHNGKIIGDVTAIKMISVAGWIKGNLDGGIIALDKAKIFGNVKAAKDIKIGQGSVIIGDLKATAAEISGAVNGDIDIDGPVVITASAIIKGNIKSATITMEDGAAVDGICSQCYAKTKPSEFFKQFENMENNNI